MALYFDRTLDTPGECLIIHSAWQKISGYFSVCTSSRSGGAGYVDIFTPGGEKKKNKSSESLMQRTYQPRLCAWHPARNLLAVGWENGEIVIWNDHNEESHQIPSLHDQAITSLQWSTNGSRLASGDKAGIVAVWRTDDRGRVQHDPLCRLEVGSEITQCIVPTGSSSDAVMSKIASLARAAVSGDEKALDQFASFENKSGPSGLQVPTNLNDGLSFYVGVMNGEVHFINGKGRTYQCMKMEKPVKKLLFYGAKDALVAVSSDLQVVVSRIHGDGKTEEISSVKLSGDGSRSDLIWAGEGLLAAATSDHSVRLWDLSTNDNYTLSLDPSRGFDMTERIVSVSYSDQKRILAAGTDKSRMAMWNFSPALTRSGEDPEKQWHLQQSTALANEALHVDWCLRQPVLGVNCDQTVLFLTEQKMNWAISDRIIAVQTAPKHAFVEIYSKQASSQSLNVSTLSPKHSINFMKASSQGHRVVHIELDTDIFFTNLAVANEALAVWNGNQVVIYDVVNDSLIPAGNFATESTVSALHDQSFFTVEPGGSKERSKIEVRNFKGTVKQVLQFQDKEGDVCIMDVCGNFLVAATNLGFVRIFDLSRRDAKAQCNAKNLAEVIPYFGSFVDVRCNSSGTKVAVIIKQDNQVISPKLYVYDVEKDRLDLFDFASGMPGDSGVPYSSEMEESRMQSAVDVAGRYPLSIHWDTEEPSLLVCEAQLADHARKPPARETISTTSIHSSAPEIPAEQLLILLYSTQDDGILVQDSIEKTADHAALIGLRAPSFYFTKIVISRADKSQSEETGDSTAATPFSKVMMRDFIGLEECDTGTRRAMLDFSLHLAMGNMDEAFKAIKLIKSEAVWESMAKMCVKTRRVDVAKVCLGRMGHVRGAHALRLAEKEPELDARIAMLAIQLGMNDEAEKLYKKCHRYDLLNEFYQATGRWAMALEVAEQLDRVHLRTTFHNYAKHLEYSEDHQAAIPMYEKAGTNTFEVPRMLFDDIDMLENYVHQAKNKAFLRWWAQYMESQGEMNVALKYYNQAEDFFSLVRVHCYCGREEKAVEIANETKNRAACYHLARHFENNQDYKQAIHFYTCAATYGNAIRICKEYGLEDQLMNLSLLGTPADMVEAAAYYETRPQLMEKAVLLYHKAGHFSKALKLAFTYEEFAALESIAQDLDERADPVLLERCANFFMEHEQYDKAVSLLVIAKKYVEAVNLCLENNVKLDEQLVERLTPSKDEAPSSGTREQLLTKLGDCCMQQGAYHLACKKYTQAGDREKAMRALLKSGDTEKIIFFAGVSRSRTIYVMAANYLQSLDWRKDPEIMKHIINYYTKGRALESLAGFYDACAQVEIDEYQNYDKAMGALTEAFKCLSKAKMSNKQQEEDRVTELKTRIALVKKFIQAKRSFDSNPEEAIKQCQVLLAEHDLESAVRIGDVYGVLIEHHAQAQAYDKAYQVMQEMQSRIPTVNMAYYVNMRTIENVHQALGVTPRERNAVNGKRADQDSDEDDMDKADITEQIYDNGDSRVDMYNRFR